MRKHVIPSAEPRRLSAGCWLALVLVACTGVASLVAPHRLMWFGAILLLPLVLAIVHQIRTAALLRSAGRSLGDQGKVGVLVYSDSPTWQAYIEEKWLPRLSERFEVLNWSHRRTWNTKSPAVRLFERYAGQAEYNPLVIVLRTARQPLVFRFYRAFLDAKHGNTYVLTELEAQLFNTILPPDQQLQQR